MTLSTVRPEPGLRELPPSLCTGREDDQGQTRLFYIRPYVAFPQGGGGESAMLPSMGAEHGVSGELQVGNPSGRPCPVRWGSARGLEARPKVPHTFKASNVNATENIHINGLTFAPSGSSFLYGKEYTLMEVSILFCVPRKLCIHFLGQLSEPPTLPRRS